MFRHTAALTDPLAVGYGSSDDDAEDNGSSEVAESEMSSDEERESGGRERGGDGRLRGKGGPHPLMETSS